MVKVTVAIPAYNEQKYLSRCLRSLLSQKLDRNQYEIIVCDDASSDQTLEVAKSFGSEIKLIKNKKNCGLPSCLNSILNCASGKYFVRVDADDYVNEEYLSYLLSYLEWNPKYDAVASDYFLVDESEKIIERRSSKIAPIGCAVMFKVSAIKGAGCYNEHFRMHEEIELMRRFQNEYEVAYLDVPLYRYRQHLANMTKNKTLNNHYKRQLEEKAGFK